jgi:hypothetical protein
MKKKIIFLIVALYFVAGISLLNGQSTGSCGTYISDSQKSLESTFSITEGKSTQSLPQVNRVIAISVFVVKEEVPPYFDVSTLNGVITNLNQYFNPIALSFKICNVTTVNNYQYDNLDINGNAKDLTTQFSEKNTINLYLVSGLADKKGNGVCGLTYMPGDTGKNFIIMTKSCFQGITLAHQIGHFFNLYHTDETTFGIELPDGSNCSIAGDKCCDTNASPDLSINGMVTNCIYSGKAKTSGQLFSPSVKNIMALSPISCRCYFSRTQYLRIIYALNNFRKYLR